MKRIVQGLLYSSSVARHYLETIPELRVTFDVSHWCNVSESLLEDQQETIDLTLQRVDHVHARIGHQEGPQVNDPRAPEWNNAIDAHFAWWDKIIEIKKQKGERDDTYRIWSANIHAYITLYTTTFSRSMGDQCVYERYVEEKI